MKQYDYLVYIGRFQPVHKGHIATIHKALELAQNVIVVVGSAFKPRTPKNPWSYEERRDMIVSAYSAAKLGTTPGRVHTTFCYDYAYNNQRWVEEIQSRIKSFIPNPKAKIGLIGLKKDQSSFYLDLFPQWEYVPMEQVGEHLDASEVRKKYFEEYYNAHMLQGLLPVTADYLKSFVMTPEFRQIKAEYDFIKKYKSGWANAPYPPVFMTTDAVVIQSGHVLLVERKSLPGKGNYALPGGFLKDNELCLDGAIRELREETRLKVPIPVLKGSIKGHRMFDHPDRSLRGRTITAAYLFELAPGELPKVKGADDAARSFWVPLSEIDSIRDIMFEDHADIISYFVGRL